MGGLLDVLRADEKKPAANVFLDFEREYHRVGAHTHASVLYHGLGGKREKEWERNKHNCAKHNNKKKHKWAFVCAICFLPASLSLSSTFSFLIIPLTLDMHGPLRRLGVYCLDMYVCLFAVV